MSPAVTQVTSNLTQPAGCIWASGDTRMPSSHIHTRLRSCVARADLLARLVGVARAAPALRLNLARGIHPIREPPKQRPRTTRGAH